MSAAPLSALVPGTLAAVGTTGVQGSDFTLGTIDAVEMFGSLLRFL